MKKKKVPNTYKSLINEFKGDIRYESYRRNLMKFSVKRYYDNEGYSSYSIDKSGAVYYNYEDRYEQG